MRRRAVVFASLALFGCGGGGGDDAPVEALTAYFDALEANDWERACELLSERGVKGVWDDQGGCVAYISDYLAEGVSPVTRKAVADGDYTVEVEGDVATVTPEGTGSYSLVREDGDWLLREPS